MEIKNFWNTLKERSTELYQNKKLILYLFFVGVATVFWFLHSLGKEYSSNLIVDVEYINFPIDVEPQEDVVRELTLNVSAFGFSLMRMQLRSVFYNYKIDVSKLSKSNISGEENFIYDLSISAIRNQFEKQLGSGIVINSVFPERAEFIVRKMGVKKLPITSTLKLEMKSGYMISEEGLLEPDSVEVRGPIILLDSLNAIYTKSLSVNNISSSFRKKIELVSPHPEIKLMQDYTTIRYEIEEYVDEEITIPVHTLNFPDSVTVLLSPQEVVMNYRTYEKAKSKITEDDFRLIVDYNTINSLSRKLEVQAIHLPKGITKIHMKPRYINYTIITKK